MTEINQEKNEQAVKVIAATIAKIAANIPADHGTMNQNVFHMTKRESEAHKMAGYFVGRMYKFSEAEEAQRVALYQDIARKAIEITGK
jgi:hypothetical protein